MEARLRAEIELLKYKLSKSDEEKASLLKVIDNLKVQIAVLKNKPKKRKKNEKV